MFREKNRKSCQMAEKKHPEVLRGAEKVQFLGKRYMEQNSCAVTIKLCAAWER